VKEIRLIWQYSQNKPFLTENEPNGPNLTYLDRKWTKYANVD